MAASTSIRARGVAALVVALALTACSLLVNKDKDQCSSAGDCGPAGTAMCLDGVCVVGSSAMPEAPTGDAPFSDAPSAVDASDGGCTPKVPVTPDDFLNEKCTTSECISFDNCVRLGLCPGVDGGDGGLPDLVTPPAGGV